MSQPSEDKATSTDLDCNVPITNNPQQVSDTTQSSEGKKAASDLDGIAPIIKKPSRIQALTKFIDDNVTPRVRKWLNPLILFSLAREPFSVLVKDLYGCIKALIGALGLPIMWIVMVYWLSSTFMQTVHHVSSELTSSACSLPLAWALPMCTGEFASPSTSGTIGSVVIVDTSGASAERLEYERNLQALYYENPFLIMANFMRNVSYTFDELEIQVLRANNDIAGSRVHTTMSGIRATASHIRKDFYGYSQDNFKMMKETIRVCNNMRKVLEEARDNLLERILLFFRLVPPRVKPYSDFFAKDIARLGVSIEALQLGGEALLADLDRLRSDVTALDSLAHNKEFNLEEALKQPTEWVTWLLGLDSDPALSGNSLFKRLESALVKASAGMRTLVVLLESQRDNLKGLETSTASSREEALSSLEHIEKVAGDILEAMLSYQDLSRSYGRSHIEESLGLS